MAETANIAKMAELLSDELFKEFFWEKTGATNLNWDCQEPHHKLRTHPSDVVFYYDEPYSYNRTYINCDLKSYAKNSITPGSVQGAVESLAKQVACAEISEQFHQLFIHDNVTPTICGLLFIYNHDGEYDKDFQPLLDSINPDKLDLPRGTKLVVLGPHDIFWLNNVSVDIRLMRGTSGAKRIPDREHCYYYYPQMQLKCNLQLGKAKAATLEMLTAPWIILRYSGPRETDQKGTVIYYKGKGESADEFMYLLDYLRHYQILEENTFIRIKVLDASATASTEFNKAIQQYIEKIDNDHNERQNGLSTGENVLTNIIKAIEFLSMNQVTKKFSEVELGMDYDQ